MTRRSQRGQAMPLALALGVLLIAGAVAAFALGRAQLAAARAQTAADLAAVSAARELRDGMSAAALDGPRAAAAWRARLSAVADGVAASSGARLESLATSGAGWPPTAVQVVASAPGPGGTRARAVARAAVTLSASVAGGEPGGRARGGGYSGPLVHRDGKPICPAVAAAFDLLDAAARADGIDLIVTSAFRSDAEQAVLFARHPDPRWVAPPGRSRHRDATELDLNMGGGGAAHAWLARYGARFGFVQRYAWEPWHWGYVPGCGEGATPARLAEARVAAAGDLPGWAPARFRALVSRSAAAHGVAPALLAALLRAESGFDPGAVSPAGAQGIAQFMPATARGIGLRDPFDPAEAIPAAARLLAGHMRAFGSVPLALAAYNAGAGAVARHGGVPPYPETQAYVARILALAGGAPMLAGGGGGVGLVRVAGRLV